MSTPVARFVAERDDGSLIEATTKLRILGGGVLTRYLSVVDSEGLGVAEAEMVSRLGDAGVRGCRVLHTAATIERGRRLFSEGMGYWAGWGVAGRVTVVPHDGSGETEFSWYGEYIPVASTIRFEWTQDGFYACLSHDIGIHEAVHALLHSYQQWPSQGAVGESIGDVRSIVSASRHMEVRELAIQQCDGDLLAESNVLSQFGKVPGLDGPALRDALDLTLLSEASDVYQTASVLTGALYEAFAERASEEGRGNSSGIEAAANELSAIVFEAIRRLPDGGTSLVEFARAMVEAAPEGWVDRLASSLATRGLPVEPADLGWLRGATESVKMLMDAVSAAHESPMRIAKVRRQRARDRARWPLLEETFIDLEPARGDDTPMARLTLDREGRVVAPHSGTRG